MAVIYLSLVLFAGIFGTGVAMYALLHRDTPGSGPLALLLLAAAMWSVTEGLSLAADGTAGTVFWAKLRLSISTIVPLAWLLMTIEYTGRDRNLTVRHLLGLLVEPIVFVVLVWTNPFHRLVWRSTELVVAGNGTGLLTDRGLVFWAHMSYSYLLIAAGAFLLVRLSLRTEGLFRTQSTALLASITVPLLANAATLFGLVPPGIDPTGVAFVATGAIVTGAILRRQLLDVTAGTREYGRDEILAELDDLVFIVDATGVVVDCNRAAVETLGGTTDDVVGRELAAVAPSLVAVLSNDQREDHRVTALELDGSVRTFDIQQSIVERPLARE